MPAYQPEHVEYSISNGRIAIAADDGTQLPAYWSHPDSGGRFPAVAILHDWWGITDVERRMAHRFAQLGYYVIVPDVFDGAAARTPQEAYALVEAHSARGYSCIDTALTVIEHHMRTDGHTAAVGLGMGGSFAYEVALNRSDIEAVVSFYGFPQRYLGQFKTAKTAIMAVYGSDEPFVSASVIAQLGRELAGSLLGHEILTLDGVGRDFLSELPGSDAAQAAGAAAWQQMLAFLEKQRIAPTKHDAL